MKYQWSKWTTAPGCTCDGCGKELGDDEPVLERYDFGKTTCKCEPCVDRDEDALSGLCDATDPRYNDEPLETDA